MQFMLMCCFDETRWSALPETERSRIMREYDGFVQDHVKSGHYLAGGKLHDSAAARTVRQNKDRPAITDGPFAETKEQIGGYHLIECADFDEALAIAQRIPTLPAGGTVEVRPLVSRLGDSA